jgi:hypothetical protein
VADAPESFEAPTFDRQRQQITVSMKGQTYPQLSIALNSASGGRRLDEEMRVIIFPNEPILYREPHSSLYRAQYQIAIEGDADDDLPGWRLRHSDGRLLSNAAVAEREMGALVKAQGSARDERERVPRTTLPYRRRSPCS